MSVVFAKMFPDSDITKGFKLRKAKSIYIATHCTGIALLICIDIAPHFKHLLKDNLSKSEVMVYSFDESLNEIIQTCEMDLIIR